LDKAMRCLPRQTDPNLIVGLDLADDAGVYKLSSEQAIVQTVDYITAIVDDPYVFGMIAAANSLSDVYAMGSKPLTAMNIIAFPSDTMDISVMTQVLKGSLAKLREAGVTLVGGHSVRNSELKYGLSVTGVVHPKKVITKSTAEVGDRLILTKPLGTGILTTALKAGLLQAETKTRLTEQMVRLNNMAAKAMVDIGVNACTDITGFGLLGHTCEMAENSQVAIEIFINKVPFLPEALEFARMGLVPEGMYANQEFRLDMVKSNNVDEDLLSIIYDPQTSGGLLISVSAEKAEVLLARIQQDGDKEAAIIGQVVDKPKGYIILV
jgi:selenide,water dikinase